VCKVNEVFNVHFLNFTAKARRKLNHHVGVIAAAIAGITSLLFVVRKRQGFVSAWLCAARRERLPSQPNTQNSVRPRSLVSIISALVSHQLSS